MRFKKYLLPVLFCLSGPMLAVAATAETAVEQLKAAPGFTLPGITEEISLDAYKGKIVYLDFWASWCSPCKDSFPWMNQMQAKYADQGVVFIAVNVDRKKKDADAFLQSTPAKFTIAFDNKGKTPKEYDVMGMPSAYLIDGSGQIVHTHIGFSSEDVDDYEAHIKQTLLVSRNNSGAE